MNTNNFAEWLVESMLSWSRWLADLLWGSINSGGEGGALNWFADHWLALVIVLIVVGSVVDWLVWMVRWRPYWLWFRRQQVIYTDAPRGQKSAHFHGTSKVRGEGEHFDGVGMKLRHERTAQDDDYFDPFTEDASAERDDLDVSAEEEDDDPFLDAYVPPARPDGHTKQSVESESEDMWAPRPADEEPDEDLWVERQAEDEPEGDLWDDKPASAAPRTRPIPRPSRPSKAPKQPRTKAKKRGGEFDWFDGEDNT